MKITVSKGSHSTSVIDFGDLVFPGEGSEFLLGRSSDCHICLDDKKISREQAKISYDGKSWFISNLSDYTGLTKNNQVIRLNEPLASGDIISAGSYSLEFFIEQDPAPLADTNQTVTNDIPDADDYPEESTEIYEETSTVQIDNPIDGEDVESLSPEGEEALAGEADEEFNSDEQIEDGFSEDFSQDFNDGDEQGDEYSDEYEQEYDEYGLGEYDGGDDVGESTQVFSGFAKFSLELFGEFAPYDTFNITENETFIGRDPEKCQIILQDPEVSSVHAVIKKNKITCVLEDLQSANGLILNGKRVNSKEISNGDEFVIGGTSFSVHVGSEFIDSQKDMLMPVEDNQVVEIEEILEVEDDDEFDEQTQASASKTSAFQDPEKRKKIIYAIVGVVVAYVMFAPDPGAETNSKEPKEKISKEAKAKAKDPNLRKLTPEQAAEAESLYQLGKAYVSEGKYPESMLEFEKLFTIKKDFKNSRQLYQLAKEKLAELEKIEEDMRKEKAAAVRKEKVAELVKKATVAVNDRNVGLANDLFTKIKELDPNNYDVSFLEADLDAWVKKKQAEEIEEARLKAERKRMEDSLAPGKRLYLREDWFMAIGALDKFLGIKGVDDDLVKEGTRMLKESKQKLNDIVSPLLGKARSLKEGEDLKGAYSTYNEILKYNPGFEEALNEMDDIQTTLTSRARKSYREALVSESLGLFEEAKEKYQEVQQIAPEDNEYYIKATDRLRNL